MSSVEVLCLETEVRATPACLGVRLQRKQDVSHFPSQKGGLDSVIPPVRGGNDRDDACLTISVSKGKQQRGVGMQPSLPPFNWLRPLLCYLPNAYIITKVSWDICCAI